MEEVLIGRPGHKRRRILWDVRFNPHCALFKALLLANLHQPPPDQQLGWEPQAHVLRVQRSKLKWQLYSFWVLLLSLPTALTS